MIHIKKWTILSIHKPKVTQFKFWLHNLVDLIFLFLLIPVSCCLVQFWRSYRLHRESQHWMGNIHIRWATFTWGGEHSHRAGIPKILAGNNYIFMPHGEVNPYTIGSKIPFQPRNSMRYLMVETAIYQKIHIRGTRCKKGNVRQASLSVAGGTARAQLVQVCRAGEWRMQHVSTWALCLIWETHTSQVANVVNI